MFKIPTFKNNKYVAHPTEPIQLLLSDIKIKSLFKFNNDKGYLLTVYIPDSVNNDIITRLQDIDNNIFNTILDKSATWFQKSFSEEELKLLYEPSFCKQSSALSVILSNDVFTKCTFNDNVIDNVEELINILKNSRKLKECLINISINNHGLYFYKEKAVSKWLIKRVDITETSYEKCYWIKEDIEDKLKDNIMQTNKKITAKIAEYRQIIDRLTADMNDINLQCQNIHKNKNWMDAVDKINKNIMLLEESIQ